MELLEYLDETNEGFAAFGERIGADKGTVHHIAYGRDGVSLERGAAIRKATGGLVTLEDLLATMERGGPKPEVLARVQAKRAAKRRSQPEAHAPP